MKLTELFKTATLLGVVGCAIALAVYLRAYQPNHVSISLPLEGRLIGTTYPNDAQQHESLYKMRTGRRLSADNETLVRRNVHLHSKDSTLPEGLLGCVLFLQSRFDPLDGVIGDRIARGLGHFLSYEVSLIDDVTRGQYAIPRLSREIAEHKTPPSETAVRLRPLALDTRLLPDSASCLEIPNAVMMSAAALEYRYALLATSLKAHTIDFDPALLWLISAASYEIGTRTVLAWWNEILSSQGRLGFESSLRDRAAFGRTYSNPNELSRALRRSWAANRARIITDVTLKTLDQLVACAVQKQSLSSEANQPVRKM